jgi:hypothetical protein
MTMKRIGEIRQNRFTSIALCVWLFIAILLNLSGCKQKDQAQEVQEQEQVEQAQDKALVDQGGLIGSDGKIKLRILCTTSPKVGRTDDFVTFLNKHFIKVARTDYKSFQEEQAKDFDVVIIDYGMERPGTPVPQLSPAYSRATVTMGVPGSMVCRRLNLKPGYL